MIKNIDSFAENQLGIPVVTLMKRSGEAVAAAVKDILTSGGHIIVLCGCGNNGGDGYAAALELIKEYDVTVYDVFEKGQKSDAGRYFRAELIKANGKLKFGVPTERELTADADLVVDAIFGTGFSGSVPEELIALSEYINSQNRIKVVAVDIPLGVSADDGAVEQFALRSDVTVALSFPKVAMFSYPAKEYVGRVIVDSLGLDLSTIEDNFAFDDSYVDFSLAKELMPKRLDNSNKGSFGKALLMVGSQEYMGAAALALEAALRGGAGYVSYLGNEHMCSFLLNKFPEALYNRVSCFEIDKILSICEKQNSILIGCGSGCSQELYNVIKSVVDIEGCPIVIDADGINSLARYGSLDLLMNSKRKIVLTPHPLEFSRLSGLPVDYIQNNRYRAAKEFAKKYGCVLLLKGAATLVTDGEKTYINGSGSSAVAKAGSGDVLAGLLVSLLASGESPLRCAALAAFIHGKVGERLSEELSSYGVTPSDIPIIAPKIMAELEGACK